jgi:hypothetical protein
MPYFNAVFHGDKFIGVIKQFSISFLIPSHGRGVAGK